MLSLGDTERAERDVDMPREMSPLGGISRDVCERRDSNPHGGYPPAPKTGAAANYATLAFLCLMSDPCAGLPRKECSIYERGSDNGSNSGFPGDIIIPYRIGMHSGGEALVRDGLSSWLGSRLDCGWLQLDLDYVVTDQGYELAGFSFGADKENVHLLQQ